MAAILDFTLWKIPPAFFKRGVGAFFYTNTSKGLAQVQNYKKIGDFILASIYDHMM